MNKLSLVGMQLPENIYKEKFPYTNESLFMLHKAIFAATQFGYRAMFSKK
jgi:hypothetical protein